MSTIHEFTQAMWLETPHGEMLAHILIDYGIEHELLWVGFLTENGQCWAFPNSKVRASKNIQAGRVHAEKPTRVRLSEYVNGPNNNATE